MSIKQAKIWKFFSSIKLAIWLLSIITVLSLIGTFIPQNEESAFYLERYGNAGFKFLAKTGLIDVYASWWFILSLISFSLNLLVCFLNRISLKSRSLGSIISHLSILVILLGALIGMFYGQKGFIKISSGEELNSFTARSGQQVNLGYSIRLNQFIYKESIDPKEKLLVYPAQKEGVCNLHDSVGNKDSLEVIAAIPTEIGIESQVADTGYKVKVLSYLPDFVMDTTTKTAVTRSAVPNNPAIQVEVSDKNGKVRTSWVFARFPDMHQETGADFKFVYNWVGRRPKDFISKVTILKDGKEVISRDIRVNEPLSFGGYTFFQASYDNEGLSWSGLQVVKDPGIAVVYSGFILLIAGLMIIFYINPIIQRR